MILVQRISHITRNPHKTVRSTKKNMSFRFSLGSAVMIRTLLLASVLLSSLALQTILPFSREALALPRQSSLRFSPSNDNELLLDQRLKAKSALERLDALESAIRANDEASLSDFSSDIDAVEEDVVAWALNLLPPPGMGAEQFEKDLAYFCDLPFSMQLAMIRVVDLPDDTLLDITEYPDVLYRIYERGRTLTPQLLEDALKTVQKNMATTARRNVMTNSDTPRTVTAETELIISGLFDGKSTDEVRFESLVKQHLGRTTRKEGKGAQEKDLQTLLKALEDKSIFAVTGKPLPIPGGFLIRGQPRKKTGKDIVEGLDEKLPVNWGAQVSYMPDFTKEADVENPDADPVLVLLNNDFTPEVAWWLLSFSTAAAVVSCFLFGFGVYGGNEVVASRLADLTATGDTSAVNWFNGLLAQLLIPIAIIQVLHELGHLLVAWKEKIKISPPTLLPFWILPFMGTQTQLKTSPNNMTSLFDFAFLGPFMGIMSSLIFLVVGVQMTLLADPETSLYFPALPVSLLRLSTLGGTIIDTLYGGAGFITAQAENANILMHPYAVAGFTGLLINSLALLPLGSTDGGRMSQALFSRNGHLLVGGVTWFALLLTTLALDQHDVLLGAWVVNNLVQNDQEVPCRDEVDKVNIWRAAAGFGLWFVAVLALVPLDHVLV